MIRTLIKLVVVLVVLAIAAVSWAVNRKADR